MRASHTCLIRNICVLFLLFTLLVVRPGQASQELQPDQPSTPAYRPCLAIGVADESFPSGYDAIGAVNTLYSESDGIAALDNQFWHAWSFGTTPSPGDRLGIPLAFGDFNGDGFSDLAIGVLQRDVGSIYNAGAVNILYGSGVGLSNQKIQIWTQDTGTLLDQAEEGDWFGYAMATGDFDHDNYDDLAIGVPSEDIGSIVDAGAVNVLYGTPSGLADTANQLWHQDVPNVEDYAETGDSFGSSLTTGDFDGDGFDDLAIGVDGEGVDGQTSAGQVQILYGTYTGLDAAGDQRFNQNSSGISDNCEPDDAFGHSLAAGNFNGDSFIDLAVGAPYEGFDTIIGAGLVHILFGTASGLSGSGSQSWNQGMPGISDSIEFGDGFGESLAAGDFNNDTYDDLVIAATGEDILDNGIEIIAAGQIHQLVGSSSGLISTGWIFNESGPYILGDPKPYEHYGSDLAVADFNRDGRDDLAVGAYGGNDSGILEAGEVNILYGYGSIGLFPLGNQLWHQDSPGILDSAEGFDHFGVALGAADQCGFMIVSRLYLPILFKYP